MSINRNVLGWFELPVSDLERATKFYETIFDFQLTPAKLGPLDMAMFPAAEDKPGSSGALVCFPDFYKPSADTGVVIYLSSQTGKLEDELGKVESAGGKVLFQKTQITPEIGFMGMFLDTEGNRVAIHSRN